MDYELMKFWAMINGVQVGPMDGRQLLACGLTPQTMVWYEGLPQWVPASTVPELAPLFVRPMPRWEKRPQQDLRPPCPPTYLVWSIVVTVLCCNLLGIGAIIYSTQVTTRYNRGDYEGAAKASNRAQAWIIITVVAALVMIPFYAIL